MEESQIHMIIDNQKMKKMLMKKKHYFQEQIEISERYGNPFTFKTTQEETVAEPKTYEEAVS